MPHEFLAVLEITFGLKIAFEANAAVS